MLCQSARLFASQTKLSKKMCLTTMERKVQHGRNSLFLSHREFYYATVCNKDDIAHAIDAISTSAGFLKIPKQNIWNCKPDIPYTGELPQGTARLLKCLILPNHDCFFIENKFPRLSLSVVVSLFYSRCMSVFYSRNFSRIVFLCAIFSNTFKDISKRKKEEIYP